MTPKDPQKHPKAARDLENGQAADCPDAEVKRDVEEPAVEAFFVEPPLGTLPIRSREIRCPFARGMWVLLRGERKVVAPVPVEAVEEVV